MQNVNPFEETFRRAVEAGKTGTLIVSEVKKIMKIVFKVLWLTLNPYFQSEVSDDTLHTPHIFPHLIEDIQTNHQILLESNIQDDLLTHKIDDLDEPKELDNNELINVKEIHSIVSLTNEILTSESITIHSNNEPVMQKVIPAQSSSL